MPKQRPALKSTPTRAITCPPKDGAAEAEAIAATEVEVVVMDATVAGRLGIMQGIAPQINQLASRWANHGVTSGGSLISLPRVKIHLYRVRMMESAS